MDSICLPSYAKVNLGLLVKGKRPDGYHEVETILQQISIKDEIRLTRCQGSGIRFYTSDETLPAGSDNLCVMAAEALQRATGATFGVEIELQKVIPVGAGLGGGSSNAAVVLLGLNKLLALGLGAHTLQEIAARLGSDVPFFIHGGCALATGRGEKLRRLPDFALNKPVVVVFPKIHVSTRWAYENLNLSLTKFKKNVTFASFKDNIINDVDFFHDLRNDFEACVFEKYPVLAEAKKLMYRCGADYVSLSGSGSALFAVCSSDEIARRIRNRFPAYRTFSAAFVRWGFGELN